MDVNCASADDGLLSKERSEIISIHSLGPPTSLLHFDLLKHSHVSMSIASCCAHDALKKKCW